MAVDLNAEVKRQKIANTLTNGDDDTDSESAIDQPETTDSTDETDNSKEDVAPPEPPSRREAGFVSLGDYSGTPAASPTPAPASVTYPPIAEDQPAPDYVPSPAAVGQPQTATAVAQPEAVGQPSTKKIPITEEEPTTPIPQQTVSGAVPAPDRLTQVERGELVGLPWHPAHPEQLEDRGERGTPITPVQPAPDRLTQVERGQLVKLPAGQPAPDTLSQVEKGIALPPKVQAAQPVTGTAPQPAAQAPVTQQASSPVSARQAAGFVSLGDYSQPQQPATQQPTAPGQVPAEPQIDYQARPGSYTSYQGERIIKNVIIHSSDSQEKGDINTLTGGDPNHQVSAHYYTTEDGRSLHFVNDNDIAYHAGRNINPSQYGNAVTIGIEQEHIDGQPWKDAEVRGTARTAADLIRRHPELTIDNFLGHSDIAPERKQDPLNFPWNNFRKYVAEDLGQPAAAGPAAAPSAQPVTKLKNGFYQDEKPNDFITGRVTTFATPDDIASGQDNGVGSPHLGKLDTTQVAGVALPQWVLQQYFGNSTAAMRQARVDVVDPQTGKRLRVPIVDIGPGEGPENAGVISDMTPALASYFGGDKNLAIKIVPKAGPDVMKNPQLFADEQAAIKNGFDSSSLDPKRQVIGPQFATRAQTQDEATAAQQKVQAAVQKQQDTLRALQSKSVNMPDWFHTLEQPIPGVTDTVRNAVREEYQKQLTAYAQDYYKEPDPGKAFDRIMSTPNLLTSAGEIWTKAGANFQHAWLSIAQQADSPTQTKLIDFVNAVQPDANPEARTALINQVMSKTGRDRVDFVNHLYNAAQVTHPDTVQNVNMYSLLDAIDVSAQPGMQAKEAANHARVTAAVNQNLKDLREDPTMENTYGGVVSNAVAQMPKNVLEAITPVIGQSAMFSEIYTDTVAGLRKDHPDWSDDQIKAKAAAASLPQDVLQELVNLATLGMGSGLTKGITNPIARIATNAIMHGSIAATAGTTQQVVANVATGRPITEGLPQAAVTGGIQGLIGGAISGRHPAEAVLRPGERPAAVEPPPVEQSRPAAELPPPPAVTEPLRPPVEPVRPVTQEDVARRAYEISQEREATGVPGDHLSDWHQAQAELSRTSEPILPGTMSEAEPINSAIANRYVQERMAAGELGQIDPSQGQSTEDMVQQGLQMSPTQRDGLIDNFTQGKGGDLDQQGAAIRSKEALLSEQARAASRAASVDPANPQLQAQAKAAADAVTAFHNGPIKKFKQVWSDAGRGLQREIPLDYTTFNGMKEAYLKGNNQEAPANLEPKLKQMADAVSKRTDTERVALNNMGKQIENQTRGKPLPNDEQVRTRLMEIMKDLPCPT
jgi:N-acetyl-anhydromuramyl-L-alanine amidase AmpD